MLGNRKSSVMAVILIIMLGLVVSGCSNAGNLPQSEMKISWNPGPEPRTLDPQMSNSTPELIIELNLFEGLLRLDKDNNPQNALADSITVTPDGLNYSVKLKDTKWSNGDPVTAEDFKFAWMHALDPEAASEYAYQLFYIKNGEAYNNKSAKAEDVGIKVIDPKTLEITLESPTPYFKSLLAFPTYFPVNKKVAEANQEWNLKPETYVSNGPFKMQSWSHNDKMVLVRNPNYWDAENVKITELTFNLVEDGKAALTAFEANQLDGTDNIPSSDIERLKQAGTLKAAPSLSTYYYCFNVTKKPFDNPKVCQALSMAIDRKALIENVVKGGETAAFAVVPGGIPDETAGKSFREAGGDYFKEDMSLAKQLLTDAGYPEGNSFPEISILYNNSGSNQILAQAIQDMWLKNLGIKVNLVGQEAQVYLASIQNQQYDAAKMEWVGDFVDPMTFLDVFVTNNGNNFPGWSNSDYDQAVATAKESGDQKVRMQAMHAAEKILITEMPLMPIYFSVNNYVVKDYIKDLTLSPFGFFDFKNAVVEK